MAQLRGKVDAGGAERDLHHPRPGAGRRLGGQDLLAARAKAGTGPRRARRYETVSGTMEPDGQGGHGAGLRDPFVGAVSRQPQPGGVRPLCGAAAGGVPLRAAAAGRPAAARRYGGAGAVFHGAVLRPRRRGRHRRAGCGVGPALCGAGGHVPQPVHRPAAGHAAAGCLCGAWACCSPLSTSGEFFIAACCTSAICRPVSPMASWRLST